MNRTLRAVAIAVVGLAFVGLGAPSAVASASAKQYECGWAGYTSTGDPLYNNCTNNNVVVVVKHWFGEEHRTCQAPGIHEIEQGNGRWTVIDAYSNEKPCHSPGYISGGWGIIGKAR